MVAADCSQLAEWSRLAGWDVEYVQVGQGELRSWLAVASCGPLLFSDEHSSLELVIHGAPMAGSVAVVLPAVAHGRCTFQGTVLGKTDLVMMTSEGEGHLVTPSDFRMWSATLPPDVLAAAVAADDPAAAIHFEEASIVRFSEVDLNVLRGIMACVATPRAVGLQAAELEDRFVEVLARGLRKGERTEPAPSTRSERLRAVQVVREHIEAHLADVLRVGDLARVAGVSVRTLEYAFRDVLGMPPLAWVRIRRLNQIRRRLLSRPAGGLRVTDVALDHGLGHLGWFAHDYKALFGELPSETAARGRRGAEAVAS